MSEAIFKHKSQVEAEAVINHCADKHDFAPLVLLGGYETEYFAAKHAQFHREQECDHPEDDLSYDPVKVEAIWDEWS